MSTATATLPDTLRLGPTHLTVTDLDRSIEFYENVIGMQTRERDGDRAVLGAGAEPVLVLQRDPEAGRPGRHAGLYTSRCCFPRARSWPTWPSGWWHRRPRSRERLTT